MGIYSVYVFRNRYVKITKVYIKVGGHYSEKTFLSEVCC
jgi:hypothetical protein